MLLVEGIIIPKESKKDEIIEKAQCLIKSSQAEAGNIEYNLYVDAIDDSLKFVEKWESADSLKQHLKTEEFLKFGQETSDLIEKSPEIIISIAEEIPKESEKENEVTYLFFQRDEDYEDYDESEDEY